MEQAAQGQHEVHSVKKRGRPFRVEREAIDPVPVTLPEKSKAQALAERVWNGQSPDTLSRDERLERVRVALEAQGMSMEGVTL
jgi:hypothetical protein